MGIEDTRYINGDCVFIGLLAKFDMPKLSAVNSDTISASIAFVKKVHAAGGNYVSGLNNFFRELELSMKAATKYISVYPNGKITERDLQARLIQQFGDDSTAQAAADNVAHMIGYTSAVDAKDNLLSDALSNPLFLGVSLGFLAYIAYQAAKERRYWQLTTKPD